jgi:hypothetical protein
MFEMKRNGLGVALVVGLVVLLAGCSTNPAINEVYLRSDGVTIEFGVGSCNADLDAEVVESDTTVEVTITAENDTSQDCADLVVITLDRPLGERELVNGSTGEVLDVQPGEN